MKAALLTKFGAPLELVEVPDPQPGPDDVVVRVMACGIDGTDLKLLDGFGYTPELPFIMGHEPAGVVEQVGRNVRDFAPGDRVIPYIFLIPPDSPWYRSPREQLCPDMVGVIGVKHVPGGYAERLCVAVRQLVRIPDSVPWHDAAVLCDAGLTAWHAVGRARLQPGETVLVIGVGGVGSFVVQFAKIAGATVVAIERSPGKCRWTMELGADAVLVADHPDNADALRRYAGVGFDCVIDVVGSAESLATGVASLKPGGRLIVVGYTPDEYRLSAKQFAQNEFELIGSRGGSFADLREVVQAVASGQIQSIVTQRRPLREVNEALAELKSGRVQGRLVLDCQ
ncbi:MAG: zinc-binding dehydrogenase [Planctomycetaceae bacterium]